MATKEQLGHKALVQERIGEAAELLAYLPIVERLDSHSIRYRCNSMLEVNQFISFILASGALNPPM